MSARHPAHIPGPGEPGTWRGEADRCLRQLYDAAKAEGREPTKQEVFDAYPFGMRKYSPYKVWCEQVRWWADGCPGKLPNQRRSRPVLKGQEALL